MQTINTNNEPIKVYGNFDRAPQKLIFDKKHTNGGGASANGLYSSLSGTPTDLINDTPTEFIPVGLDYRDDGGSGVSIGDDPIVPDIKPPLPVDPAITNMVADDREHKNIGIMFLLLILVAIGILFVIKKP